MAEEYGRAPRERQNGYYNKGGHCSFDFPMKSQELRKIRDWNSSKTFHEHYSTTGLNARMLQICQYVENDNPHTELRQSLQQQKFATQTDDGHRQYERLEDA